MTIDELEDALEAAQHDLAAVKIRCDLAEQDRDYFKAAYARKLDDEAKALEAAQAAVAESERLKHLAIHWEQRAIANGAKAEVLRERIAKLEERYE